MSLPRAVLTGPKVDVDRASLKYRRKPGCFRDEIGRMVGGLLFRNPIFRIGLMNV